MPLCPPGKKTPGIDKQGAHTHTHTQTDKGCIGWLPISKIVLGGGVKGGGVCPRSKQAKKGIKEQNLRIKKQKRIKNKILQVIINLVEWSQIRGSKNTKSASKLRKTSWNLEDH